MRGKIHVTRHHPTHRFHPLRPHSQNPPPTHLHPPHPQSPITNAQRRVGGNEPASLEAKPTFPSPNLRPLRQNPHISQPHPLSPQKIPLSTLSISHQPPHPHPTRIISLRTCANFPNHSVLSPQSSVLDTPLIPASLPSPSPPSRPHRAVGTRSRSISQPPQKPTPRTQNPLFRHPPFFTCKNSYQPPHPSSPSSFSVHRSSFPQPFQFPSTPLSSQAPPLNPPPAPSDISPTAPPPRALRRLAFPRPQPPCR